MENFSYHVPFYVVTGGIDPAGHSSELTAGQVGLFDRSTFSVATGAGSGKEFFFAQGHNGGFDWYGNPVTESHKSPFFYGADVDNMYVSLPKQLQNEEWVIGFNGSTSSKGLTYEAGKPIRVKLYFHGQPTYRFFGGPKEYTISYTPPVPCEEPCEGNDCPEPIVDCLTHTQALANAINEHVELSKFGVRAQLVTAPYTATTPNMEKYCLSVCDNGDTVALQSVQAQFPDKRVTRTSRVGSTSTYEFCQREPLAAPASFQQSASVLEAVCGACTGLTGATLVPAKDVYIAKRVVTAATDFTTDNARDTFADTVGTAYGSTVDADKTFLGQDGSLGIVKFAVAAGTVVTAIGSDTVEFSHTSPAECAFAAPAAIAWTACGTGIASSRTLRINNLNRLDCSAGDRIADLTSILAGVEGIKLNTITKIAGVACVDDYTVQQDSVDCLSEEECLSNQVSFTYDSLPSFEGQSFEVVPVTVTENAARKCGLRISAGYIDPKNGNCFFDITSYFEVEPLKMEISLLGEDDGACDIAKWPTVLQTKRGQIARQSGEEIIREVILKDASYLKHLTAYSNDPLMNARFDNNVVERVDRTAFYKLYYITFRASYGNSYRKNEQEKFTAKFAFKENDPAAKEFEEKVISVLSGKSGKIFHIAD